MYVCNTHTHTHTHTNIHIHTHIHVHIQMHGYAYTHIHSHIHTYQDSKAEVVEEHNFRRSSLPRGTCPVRTCSVYYTSIGFLQAVAGTCACEQMYAVLMCVYIHTYKCMHTYRCMACQHTHTIIRIHVQIHMHGYMQDSLHICRVYSAPGVSVSPASPLTACPMGYLHIHRRVRRAY